MSHLRYQSKLNGLYALKGSWIKAMLIFLILALLSFGIKGIDNAYRDVFSIPINTEGWLLNTDFHSFAITAVFSVITFFIMFPLLLGMFEWYWNLTGGEKTGIGDIFAWYGSGRLYGKSILLGIDVGIRCLFWGILTCGIPVVMFYAASYFAKDVDIMQANLSAAAVQKLLISGVLSIFGLLLLFGGILLYIYITSKYILAPFLMVEDNSKKVSDVVKDSIKYSKNYRWEYTKFMLSYVGWAVISICIVPLFYSVPYFSSSLTIFSKHIIYSQRPSEKNEKKEDTIQFSAEEK